MRIRNTEIKIFRGDISTLKVDAIVNAANNKLLMGGGVAGAIKKAAGEIVEKEALSKGPIQIGEAIFSSAGNLKAKYIIHLQLWEWILKLIKIKSGYLVKTPSRSRSN